MALKIAGCIFVIIGSCTYGIYKGNIRKQRIAQLLKLKTTFILIAGEIGYGYSTMEEIFKNISDKYKDETGEFYRYMYERIIRKEYISLVSMWEEACECKLSDTCLESGDICFIKEIGMLPVQLDKDMQLKFIDEKNIRLEEIIAEAKEKIEAQCHVYKVISATIGIFIVLILI